MSQLVAFIIIFSSVSVFAKVNFNGLIEDSFKTKNSKGPTVILAGSDNPEFKIVLKKKRMATVKKTIK